MMEDAEDYMGGSGNATKIQLSETYTFNGMTASVG